MTRTGYSDDILSVHSYVTTGVHCLMFMMVVIVVGSVVDWVGDSWEVFFMKSVLRFIYNLDYESTAKNISYIKGSKYLMQYKAIAESVASYCL